MKLAGCLLAVMLIGAGPATKPATISDVQRQLAAMAEEIAQLRAELQELRERMPAADARHQADGSTSIEVAIKERRIVPGMTLADVRKAMNHEGRIIEESAGGSTYKFLKLSERKFLEAEYEVVFVGGKVNRYTRLDDPVQKLRIPPGPPASFK